MSSFYYQLHQNCQTFLILHFIEETSQFMKSEHLGSKVFFKLNNHLIKENLPNISPVKLKEQQNNSFTSMLEDGFKFISKKPIKLFNLPKRFKKHNNKIEKNMSFMNKTSCDFTSTAATKTCCSSFYKPTEQSRKQGSRMSFISKQRQKISLNQIPKRTFIQPRTLQGIKKAVDLKYNKKNGKEKDEGIKMYEKMLRLRPTKISKQISQIFQENKHLYMLSRFTLLELKSYYSAILQFSKNQPSKFKYAFEVMLNLAGISIREKIMTQCFKELLHYQLTFTKFLKAFTIIQQKLRKQAIIDYFEILFQDVKKSCLSYEELTQTFEGRMKKQVAQELSFLLYDKLEKNQSEKINKQQIHSLCYENQQFCTMFYALNDQNMLISKFATVNKPNF